MADKRIGELPAAAALYDDSMFVIEQEGEAMRTDMRKMRDSFLAGGTNNLIIRGNLKTQQADATALDVFAALDASKGVKLYLYDPDEMNNPTGKSVFKGASFNNIVFDQNTGDYSAYFYAREETAVGAWKYTTYILGTDGSMSVYDEDVSVSENSPSTVRARLKLVNTPVDELEAANKKYVDSVVGTGPITGVSSVNGQTGDVTLPEVSMTATSLDHGTLYHLMIGEDAWSISVPNYAEVFPSPLHYYAQTGVLDGSYSQIALAANFGGLVHCIIEDGDDVFYTSLAHQGLSSEDKTYYAFYTATGKVLRVFEDNTTSYTNV